VNEPFVPKPLPQAEIAPPTKVRVQWPWIVIVAAWLVAIYYGVLIGEAAIRLAAPLISRVIHGE
jgi:hypothetical protein